jgi:tetratricopeptide (TPR) repeat protein
LAKQGHIEAAMIQFRIAMRLDPQGSSAYYRLGLLLKQAGDDPGAERAFRRAIELEPNLAAAHYEQGELLAKRDWQSAMAEFRVALRCRNGNYPEAQNRLGALLLSAGDVKEAEAQLKSALAAWPDFAPAHMNLGLVYESDSRFEAAAAELQRAVRLQPASAEAHYELGKALRRQGNNNGARREFEVALRLNPDLKEPHYQLARLLQTEGYAELARAEFEQASNLNQRGEKLAQAVQLNNRGLDLAAGGNFSEAVRVLRQAIPVEPDYVPAHYNLGLVLADSGDFKSAAAEVRTALFLQPGQARIHYELGRVLQRAGDISNAESELEWAAQLDPTNSKIAEVLHTLPNRTDLRRSSSGAEHVATCLFTPRGLDDLGISISEKGDIWGGIALFLRALSLKPDFFPARCHLASAYLGRGNYDQAALEFRKALMLRGDDAHVHFQLGLSLEKSGDKAGAIEQFGMVQKTQPDFRQAQQHLNALLRKEAVHCPNGGQGRPPTARPLP